MARMLPEDIDKLVIADTRQMLSLRMAERIDPKDYEENYKFVEKHDHWQDAHGWLGPTGGTEPNAIRTRTVLGVKRQFTPVDGIGEVLGRQTNGILKTEADVRFPPLKEIPTDEFGHETEAGKKERARLEKASAEKRGQLSAFWDRVKFWKKAREAVRRSRYAGRATLRVWVPGIHLTDDGVLPTGLTFEQALAKIEIEAPEPDQAAVWIHPKTRQPYAIYRTVDEKGKEVAEVWTSVDGKTMMRTVTAGRGAGEPAIEVDIGGRLPIIEMEADILITGIVRQQQRRLNMFESNLVRVGEMAAFPERYVSNAEDVGVWDKSKPDYPTKSQVWKGETYYLHTEPRTLGASIVTELRGFPYKTDSAPQGGGMGFTTPQVTFKEPTDPRYAIDAAWHARRTILEQCHQGHVLTNTEAAPSGYSREQARADYEDDLMNLRAPVEGMLRDTIAVVFALAAAMSNEVGDFLKTYRIEVNVTIDSGPLSPDERRAIVEEVKAGLMSKTTALAKLGHDDADAEMDRIDESPLGRLAILKERMAVLNEMTRAFDLAAAAKFVGFSDAEIALLTAGGSREDEDGFGEDEDETTTNRRPAKAGTNRTTPPNRRPR